jgi:mono/diheme cytochrome c family protein
MFLSRSKFSLLMFSLVMSTGMSTAAANEDIIDAARAEAQEKHGVDVKKIFGTQCGLCHGGYGTSMGGRGGGPKLSATAMTAEQVHGRIAEGKQGMMPSFKKMLKPEEIDALTTYIMALKSSSK